MRRQVADWLADAQRDLAIARHLRSGGFYHAAVHYARLHVGKMLKAAYPILRREEIPPGLDLGRLARGVGLSDMPDNVSAALQHLAPLYGATRYADAAGTDPGAAFGPTEADRAITEAEEFGKWLTEMTEMFRSQASQPRYRLSCGE
ncbi:MAG: HEPN domain-containing protein [Armatimonadota bacterium]